MKTVRLARLHGLVCLLAITTCLSACGGSSNGVQVADKRADGESMTADDKAAAEFIRSKLAENWVKGADGWTTQYQQHNMLGQVMPGNPNLLYKQIRELSFAISPDTLTEAMKLNGTDYRAEAVFKDSPVRYYQLEGTYEGPAGWGNWKDGTLLFQRLAVERRKGAWLISDSDLFAGVRPQSQVPKAN